MLGSITLILPTVSMKPSSYLKVTVNISLIITKGCDMFAAFGVAGTKTAEYCKQHAHDGMVDVWRRRCRGQGCGKQPSFGVAGKSNKGYCAQHAVDGMVNVNMRKCITEGCRKQPSFGVAGTKTAEYCKQHAHDGMVNVRDIICRTEGCGTIASFGVTSTKTAEYCKQHAPDGIVNVRATLCSTAGCGKRAAFGVARTNTTEYCRQHALGGMVNVRYRMRRTADSIKLPSFGVAGTKTAEYCRQHEPYRMANVYRKRITEDSSITSALLPRSKSQIRKWTSNVRSTLGQGVVSKGAGTDTNHHGKESNGAASPSGSKHKTVHSPPAQSSPFSGSSRGSRKQVRHLHNMPTALVRAVALESGGGAVTMPETEGQKSPVKQDYMKTEVHVSV